MTVWVYGDSYCTDDGVDYAWFDQLSKLMKQTVVTKGLRGVNNDWIARQIAADSKEHQPGDFIIMVQTQENRHWFWEDKPEASNWQNHTNPVGVLGITKAELRAAEDYVRYLWNDRTIAWHSFTNTTWLAAYALTNRLRHLIVPGFINSLEPFNPTTHVTGTLTEFVSYREFPDRKSYEIALRSPQGDSRANHLSKNNHTILARKIADSWNTGELDLTQGFDLVKLEFSEEDYQ